MATFSISEALGSGFRLIGRRPFSLLAWGLAYFLIVLVPVGVMIAWVGPDFLNMFHELAERAGEARDRPFDPSFMMPFQGKMMLLQPVLFLTTILGRAVLAGAAFRAVLEPRNKGFFGLRLGGQELWLALLGVVFAILMVLVMIAIGVACAIVGLALTAALAAAHQAQAWTALSWVVVCVIGVLVMIWVILRLSLAFPMTFAEREFRLFESWKLTKGHAWSLFFLALLLFLILAIFVLVLEGALFATVFHGVHGFVDFTRHAERFNAFFQQPPEVLLRTLGPWLAVGLLVGSWLTGAVSAISLAPWAVAYQGLSGGRSSAPPAWEPEPAPAPVTDHHDDHAGHGDDHSGGHDDGHHGH